MSAFAYYQANAYDDCINTARRYVTLHPGSPDAAYAQFLIGASYFDQMPEISRDQDRTDKAMQALGEVVRKYPDSEYAVAAKRKIEIARDQLAGKEMDIGRQNLNSKNYVGAINRFKVVVTKYQTTRHVEEALTRLTEAYMAMGIADEAQTAAAVLGHNFPDSRWYKDAYNLVKAGGFEPNENRLSWISRAFQKLSLGYAALVRHVAEHGQVTACFEVEPGHPARTILAVNDISAEDELILRRVQLADGRTRAFVNDQPVSVQVLKSLSVSLVEIHGQHDERALVDTATHRSLLDAFGALEGDAAQVARAWSDWRAAREAVEAHRARVEQARREAEWLRHAVDELGRLAPEPGEEKALAE